MIDRLLMYMEYMPENHAHARLHPRLLRVSRACPGKKKEQAPKKRRRNQLIGNFARPVFE